MDALLEHAMACVDGRLPPRKPPTRPVKLGNGGDRKPAGALKPGDLTLDTLPVAREACPAQTGRPDFADDIDRIVAQLLSDGDVRWSEARGFYAPKRRWRFPTTEA